MVKKQKPENQRQKPPIIIIIIIIIIINASQRRCLVLYDPATSSDRLNEGLAMVNQNKSLRRISIQEG